MKIEFFVPGICRTAGSKSAFKNKVTGKVNLTHAGKYSKGWMDSVKWFAMKKTGRMILWEGPIILRLVFRRTRPKSHYRTGRNAGIIKPSAPAYPTSKPDLTKLTRAIEDALTGIVWKDDAQVVRQETGKVYCKPEEKPGVCIIIKENQNEANRRTN